MVKRVIILMVRSLLLLALAAGLAAAVFVLWMQWRGLGGSDSLNPVERVYLDTYLSGKAEALNQPAGSGVNPVNFTVAPGQTADQIAQNLANNGLVDDTELFLNYARYHGLDAQLEAGEFGLSPRMTIPEIATTLTNAIPREVEVRFLEGWRLEEMAASLAVTQPAQAHADTFLAIAQRRAAFDVSQYDFLVSLPPDATLEGFLFPDTYRLPLDADAAYLVDVMLRNFGERVTPTMRQAFGANGLTLRQAVTLASIVEREAVNAAERPSIASVFYNRLALGMRLEADPTVQYAIGQLAGSDEWWPSPLMLADLEFNSPYNTYVYAGLPPGPIANPGLASLTAVAEPAQTDFIFFVADCTSGDGRHNFSVTYEEHLAYVQQCR